MVEVGKEFGLDDVTYGSFHLRNGYKFQLSASDAVYGVFMPHMLTFSNMSRGATPRLLMHSLLRDTAYSDAITGITALLAGYGHRQASDDDSSPEDLRRRNFWEVNSSHFLLFFDMSQ